MAHFVYKLDAGGYVGTRKNNGRQYESRPSASDGIGQARVFNTRAAATRAGSALGLRGAVVEVSLVELVK